MASSHQLGTSLQIDLPGCEATKYVGAASLHTCFVTTTLILLVNHLS
jgi:hypothetical protein